MELRSRDSSHRHGVHAKAKKEIGFVRASNPTPDEPLGAGGEALHKWAFGEDEDVRRVLAEGGRDVGAVIAGRRTYDDSVRFWGPDGPTGAARVPVVVVTHEAPSEAPQGGVYRFVTGGIEAALDDAREVAGEANITVMGGPDTGRQYLRAGLVDELSIHVAPILLGDGPAAVSRAARRAPAPRAPLDGPNTERDPREVPSSAVIRTPASAMRVA
jgi:dihydrofolate reductase